MDVKHDGGWYTGTLINLPGDKIVKKVKKNVVVPYESLEAAKAAKVASLNKLEYKCNKMQWANLRKFKIPVHSKVPIPSLKTGVASFS